MQIPDQQKIKISGIRLFTVIIRLLAAQKMKFKPSLKISIQKLAGTKILSNFTRYRKIAGSNKLPKLPVFLEHYFFISHKNHISY
jgi:hypothetical protein